MIIGVLSVIHPYSEENDYDDDLDLEMPDGGECIPTPSSTVD
jgi:hypothetical protein